MRTRRTLSAKLGTVGAALLLLVLSCIGITLWVTWQLEGGAAALNEAGRLRMQTWRLAQALGGGDAARARDLAGEFDRSVRLLRGGDPSRPLFVPRDPRSQATFAVVQSAWAPLRVAWTAQQVSGTAIIGAQAEAFVEHVDTFVRAIESEMARLTTILNAAQFVLMALAIASAVTLIYTAYLFVFDPLSRLQAGLARVGEGDLKARVVAPADDEFGDLAAGFNRMAAALQGLYQGLEAKVQEKTLGLQAQHTRLAALYEAAAFVARADTLDELAHGFARQLRRVAGADASAVRWSDEDNQRYMLLASDCLPQQLVEAERCVATGACFCGQPQGDARTRVIPIRTGEGVAAQTRLGHCERAGFETVVSVPVRLHERMVGELDLYYRHAAMPGDDDRALLETLASHLAGAIEALRAGALEREAAVAEERSLLARELHDSIAQSLSFLKIQAGLLRDQLRRGDAARVERTLAELDAGIRESLADVRELLLHFRTRTNTEDIASALRTTLVKFEHQTGMATHLSVEGEGMPLPADVQVQVLHVVQEALSNVRKHAGAREVWVEVQQAPPWRIEVRDDGRGFDVERRAGDEAHVGLRIMRERAAHIGAEVELSSVEGAGTCVALTLAPRRALAA